MKRLPDSFFLLLLIFFLGCNQQEKTSKPLPNIILLMGDDHGWEETGYNGHDYLQTPVLDKMAANGLRFDRFYSAAPSCSPTRGSVITGRHPNRYGTFAPNWSIRPEEISIAQILKQAGYKTAHFGKWHVGPVKATSPINPGAMGFDTWLSHDNFFEIDPVLSRDGKAPVRFKGESSEILVDETIHFIQQAQKQDKPFLVVVWFGSPHEPYSGLEKDLLLYQDLPDSLSEHYVKLTSMETGLQVQRPLDSVLQERYAEITAMDRAIGKLRQYLVDKNIKENTMLWYCGDNGIPTSGMFNSPFRGHKGLMYEGGIRVPGIIEWPAGIKEGRVTHINAVTSDMLPTLAELTNQQFPDRPLDGISLMPLIKEEMDERSNPIFFWDFETSHIVEANPAPYIDPKLQEGTTPLVKKLGGHYTRSFQNFYHLKITKEDYAGERAVMDNRYKLVVDAHGEGSGKELFDILNDPSEQNNLITNKPEIVAKLEQQLHDWQQSVLKSLTGNDYNKEHLK